SLDFGKSSYGKAAFVLSLKSYVEIDGAVQNIMTNV
ncbi:MAG: hypothetical protein ACI9DF_003974, partial [Verrucomicrobiales bacterium]